MVTEAKKRGRGETGEGEDSNSYVDVSEQIHPTNRFNIISLSFDFDIPSFLDDSLTMHVIMVNYSRAEKMCKCFLGAFPKFRGILLHDY